MSENQRLVLLMLCFFVFCISQVCAWDYCRKKSFKCATERRHFSCTGELKPEAAFMSFLPISMKIRDLFLSLHNDYRELVARGAAKSQKNYEKYPSASRMREFIWDRELEYIAHLHAKNCHSGQSSCHRSTQFLDVGQNLAFHASNLKKEAISIINASVLEMFNEKDLVENPKDLATKYESSVYKTTAGRFAQIMSDRTHRVGCALAVCSGCRDVYENIKKFCYYLTCQYDTMPTNLKFLYKTGKPQEHCIDWYAEKSRKYKHLCTNID